MKEYSLDELAAAFGRWRRKKRHIRERVPDELWEQALGATHIHGTKAVARATRIEQYRLVERDKKANTKRATMPTFTRLSITAPSATTYPIAEVETTTGLRLRVFVQTQEMLSLLSSLCGNRGAP